MPPNAEAQPPGKGSGLKDAEPGGRVVVASVDDPDTWATIRAGWIRAGDTLPRRGSLAWRCLPADDPVRLASLLADDLEVDGDLRRHGPAVAKALQQVTG
jgi:hypothetical protein